jgi:hypothetical protein
MARQEIQVGRKDMDVFIVLNGRRLFDLGWKKALEFSVALRTQWRAAAQWSKDGSLPSLPELAIGKLSVRHEGAMVLVLFDGALKFEMPWRAAARLWRAVVTKARQADELAHADQVVLDGALMLRTGAPCGLTDNPAIQAEVVKAAVHDRDLRRYLPGGVKGTVILGAPVIRLADPGDQLRQIASGMDTEQRHELAAMLGAN